MIIIKHTIKGIDKQRKIDTIELNVWVFNESAIKFYEMFDEDEKDDLGMSL